MKELLELVRIFEKSKLPASQIWPAVIARNSMMEHLYQGVQQGLVQTDDDIQRVVLGQGEDTARGQRVKNRLKERLTDVVFLLDFSRWSTTDRQRNYFECHKKWSAAMILMAKNSKAAAVELLEKVFKQAVHFEFTDIVVSILSSLRLHYGAIQGDAKKYEYYRAQYNHYQQVWMLENEAEDLYTHFVSHYVASRSVKEDMETQARAYYEQVKPGMEQCSSFRLHLCGRLLELMVYSSCNDYQKMAVVCEDAIRFFEAKPYNSSLPLQVFYYQLIVCYVQMRSFDKGMAIMTRYEEIYENGSFNWFKLQELFFMLAMHTRNYNEAYLICNRVIKHQKLAGLPAAIQEIWRIFEAYSHYIQLVGRVSTAEESSFRVARFLNEIPRFSKDKQGMNIPVLIAQILFMFAEGRYLQSIDRIEAIEKYCSRYLKKNDTFRSNCFIKMLLQIPEAGFHREAVNRYAKKWLDQLKTMPIEISNQGHGIEIIPYEDLWEMALESLQLKTIQARGASRRISGQ